MSLTTAIMPNTAAKMKKILLMPPKKPLICYTAPLNRLPLALPSLYHLAMPKSVGCFLLRFLHDRFHIRTVNIQSHGRDHLHFFYCTWKLLKMDISAGQKSEGPEGVVPGFLGLRVYYDFSKVSFSFPSLTEFSGRKLKHRQLKLKKRLSCTGQKLCRRKVFFAWWHRIVLFGQFSTTHVVAR